MTLNEIRQCVRDIREESLDSESAHADEDSLHVDFIAYVAKQAASPGLAAKAALVLTTQEIEFSRWYT